MGSCTRVTAKRYASRPSPPYHAGDCAGKTMKGNDGKEYLSVADKRGVYTWKPTVTRKAMKGKRYEIHDNGGRPFIVAVDGNTLQIYTQDMVNPDAPMFEAYAKPTFFKSFKAKKIWLEDDVLKVNPDRDITKPERGHTILAQLSAKKFLFIGWQIFTFELEAGDSPVTFESYIGPNDVPYSYLVGKTHTYFLTESNDVGIVANEWLDPKRDSYGQFYGHLIGAKGPVKKHITRRSFTLVHKRNL
jgi:hypothetical protein